MRIETGNRDENENNSRSQIPIRAAVGIGSVILISLNTLYGFALPSSNVECILDWTFSATSDLNTYFSQNEMSRKLLLVFSSLCVDFVMISLGIFWVLYSKSWRLIGTLTAFYLFRGMIQIIFQERTPEGFLWEYPGFPSIMVSYLKTETFFFSTVTGFLTIASLEFHKLDNKQMLLVTVITGLINILARIVLRRNYIIDILSAIIIAHFAFILSDEFCANYIDNSNFKWLNLGDKNLDSSISTTNELYMKNRGMEEISEK